jgi:hypothetical protein
MFLALAESSAPETRLAAALWVWFSTQFLSCIGTNDRETIGQPVLRPEPKVQEPRRRLRRNRRRLWTREMGSPAVGNLAQVGNG